MQQEDQPGGNGKRDNGATRRRYHSPLRQQQSEETRRRIVTAGAELVHGFAAWDWTNLTARAVSERAGVSERTVQRYFPAERQLRDAVLQRLVEESGIDLGQLELSGFAAITKQMFSYLSSFAITPEDVEDPSFASLDRARREALLDAVMRATPGWTDTDRRSVAALLDILWNLQPYERLLGSWELPAERAAEAITWMIGLIERAIEEDRPPGGQD